MFARASDVTGWCTTPSLVVARTDATGLITGTVQITGTARGITVDGPGPAPDQIGGLAAGYFTPLGDAPEPADAQAAVHSWLITDDNGEQWYAIVNGYPRERARDLLQAASFEDRAVTWDASRAPGLEVLHRRTGKPYPTTSQGEDWYIRFQDGERERTVQAQSGRAGYSALSAASVDSRITVVDGRRMRILEDQGRPVAVYGDFGSGGTLFADVNGDLDQVLDMLSSVGDLDRNDPRLTELALPEDYSENR